MKSIWYKKSKLSARRFIVIFKQIIHIIYTNFLKTLKQKSIKTFFVV